MANLRAVEPGEKAEYKPKTMLEATTLGRREFLVMAREEIARTITDGVPSHALARLISEMDRLDVEIRRFDSATDQEAMRGAVADEAFDAEAI